MRSTNSKISKIDRRIIVFNALAVLQYRIHYGYTVSIVKGHSKDVVVSDVVTIEEPILVIKRLGSRV